MPPWGSCSSAVRPSRGGYLNDGARTAAAFVNLGFEFKFEFVFAVAESVSSKSRTVPSRDAPCFHLGAHKPQSWEKVELHLAHPHVEHALACVPWAGSYKARLVAVIASKEIHDDTDQCNQSLGRASESIAKSKAAYFDADDMAPFALMPVQRMHFTFAPGGDSENVQAAALRSKLPLDPSAVSHALQALVQRHPMLRSRFSASQMMYRLLTSFARPLRMHLSRPGSGSQHPPRSFLSAELDGDVLRMVVRRPVLDFVFWRALLCELKQCLSDIFLPPISSLSFQSWTKLQLGYATTSGYARVRIPTLVSRQQNVSWHFQIW
jgi:hypothetical protein